ncbi:MAG: hypothetical protein IJ078_08435 [Succinivibrionaceae bacterium]|nr:hypothetical protein [Succinivibrionaceae bacterium]
MTNSISMYNRFIEDSGNRSVLPELIEADLKEIKTVTVDREHLADYIKNNQDTWFMYTDEVRIGPNISYEPQRYLLEGEFVSGESTVRIKLLHDQTYLVSFYESDPHSEPSGSMCYFDKELMARRDLQKYVKKLKYRIWYKLEDQGRWVPFLQQFTGFSK